MSVIIIEVNFSIAHKLIWF